MKKYLTDNFGYTLRNIRENLGLTQTEVFQGILARSTWYSYEVEEIVPDIITFITLLERMGVSSDRFEFIVPEEVHKFYSWYEECLNYIEAKEWDKLIRKREEFKILKQINVKIQNQYNDFMDYIIERYANRNLDKALFYIRKALLNTVVDIENIVSERLLLSIFEGHLLANYYDLLYDFTGDKSITPKLYSFYEYYSNRLKDDLIKVKIIPRIVLILLKHDEYYISRDIRLKIEQEALETLIKNNAIREVPEVLNHLINDEMSYGLSKIHRVQREALIGVFEKYGIFPDFRVELERFERKKYLLLGDILKLRRIELGLTIEEAAVGICSVSTYVRTENGKTTPNKTTINLMKEKLKLRAVYYSSEVETEDYGNLILNSECRRLVAVGRYDEAREKYYELYNRLDLSIPVNRQIIGFAGHLIESTDNKDNLTKLWKLLLYNDVKFEKRNYFSREELEILSFIVWEKAKNDIKNGIEFLELILKKESRQRGTYYSRTAIIERDLIKLLKNNKEYDKSYRLAKAAIEKMFIENEEGLLLDILDFVSTIEEDLGNRTEAAKICKDMFYIAELYEIYDAAKSIKRYYEETFDKNKIWY